MQRVRGLDPRAGSRSGRVAVRFEERDGGEDRRISDATRKKNGGMEEEHAFRLLVSVIVRKVGDM